MRAQLRDLWLLVLATFLAWGPATVGADFAYDDREAIVGNPVVEGGVPALEAFGRDYWDHRQAAGHWRPTATLALRLDHPRGGAPDPERFRRSNVVLHGLVAMLLWALLRRLEASPRAALAGALLLAVHPVLADSVAWISGRTSMLSALGGLAGAWWLAGRPGRPWVSGLAAALGLFAGLCGKEDALVFAPAFVLLALRRDRGLSATDPLGARARRRPHTLATLLGVGVALAAWLALRQAALGTALPTAPHAPLAQAPLLERLSVGARAWVELLRLAAAPLSVPAQLPTQALPLADARESLRAVLAGSAWLGWWAVVALAAARVRRGSVVAGAFLAAALALLPTAQLLPAGEVLAPRFLYLPLLLAAVGAAPALARLPRPLALGLVLLALVLCQGSAAPYRDAQAYWNARAEHEPRSSSVWNALGTVRAQHGEEAAAREAFERAIELDPRYSRPRVNLGLSWLRAGDLERAEQALDGALREGPRNPLAHAAWARLRLEQGRAEEAAEAYARARELAPRNALLWRGEGRAWLDAGRPQRAVPALERALELDPRSPVVGELLVRARQEAASVQAR